MNSQFFLSATHRHNVIVKLPAHRLNIASPLTINASALRINPISQTCQCKRSFHLSSVLKENGIGEWEKTFWQSYRASSEPRDTMLRTPNEMPYKKGKYVTDQITRPQADRYLYPLFLRGWEVVRTTSENGNLEDNLSPYLASEIVLESNEKVEPIYAFLISLQKQEKHHILFNVLPGPKPVLSIQSQTHSARKALDGSPGSKDYELTEPGITLRDVRFAVLLEQELLRSKALFVPNRRVECDAEEIYQLLTTKRKEWDSLMSRYPWKA